MVDFIGEAAGNVWSYLDQNGRSNLTQIKNGVKGDANLDLQAIGWPAREDKLNIEKKGGLTIYSLKIEK